MDIKHDLYLGDCEEVLRQITDNSVDLIFYPLHPMQTNEKTHMAELFLMIMWTGFAKIRTNVKSSEANRNFNP